MKVIIDVFSGLIDDAETGKNIIDMRQDPYGFRGLLNKILSPSQLLQTETRSGIYIISKKRQVYLTDLKN